MNVLEKLKKLILTRDHPNTPEGEVMTAAQAITNLLYKYNLEESDVILEENPITCREIDYRTKLCGGKWYASLVAVITNNNLCKCLIISIPKSGRLSRDKFQLVGRKTNLELVEYMIDSYASRFYLIGKQKYKLYKGELTENKFLRSFLEGCAAGLNRKYLELRNDANNSALIVSTNDEISEYLSGRNIRKSRDSKEQINMEAYSTGYETGRNIEINQGINNSKCKLLQ